MSDEASPEIPFTDGPVKGRSTDDLSPADLLDLKSRLEDELNILEKAKITASVDEDTSCSTIIELETTVSELKEQLVEDSNKMSLHELIIKRMEMHKLLCSVLFRENKSFRDSKITENCLEELPIASEIMRIQKDVAALQKTHDDLKMKNLKLKHENIAIMEKLKKHSEKAHSASVLQAKAKDIEFRALKSELDVRHKSCDILKNIIPRLAVGAGNIGPKFQDLILKCGEPLNL